MSAYRWIDRHGYSISQARHAELQQDESYVNVRQFENGQLRLTITWIGQIAKGCFPGLEVNFKATVFNFTPSRHWVPDPVTQGRTFSKEEEAIMFYEHFLLQWAGARYEPGGMFLAVGNRLGPKPPLDADCPVTPVDAGEVGACGAW